MVASAWLASVLPTLALTLSPVLPHSDSCGGSHAGIRRVNNYRVPPHGHGPKARAKRTGKALKARNRWQPFHGRRRRVTMCVAPPKSLAQPTARRRSTLVEDQLRKHKKSFQSFALFIGLLLLLRSKRRESFDKLTNPLSLTREYYGSAGPSNV